MDDPRLITLPHAALLSARPERVVRRWIATGRLTLHREADPKSPPRILIDKSELVKFMEELTPVLPEFDDETEESDPNPRAFMDEEKTTVVRRDPYLIPTALMITGVLLASWFIIFWKEFL